MTRANAGTPGCSTMLSTLIEIETKTSPARAAVAPALATKKSDQAERSRDSATGLLEGDLEVVVVDVSGNAVEHLDRHDVP